MQSILPVFLTFLLAGVVVAILWKDWVHERHLRLRVKKLYASQLFEDILPLLKTARKRHVEQLMVDKTGIVLRYLHPVGSETAFLMRPHGYAYLTPELQEALRVVLEECLPKLKDTGRYYVSRRRIRLVNGDIEYAYRYTMLNAYKCKLSRAPYYDGSLQTRLW